MKILAICGSPRGENSQTLRLTRAVAQGAREAGATVDVVDICKLTINYCTGCTVCYATGKCVQQDAFAELYGSLLDSDGLILASPTYLRQVTAQLKTLLDRMADAIHCQLLSGKYACAVSTAGGPSYTAATDYMTGMLHGFGAYSVGSVGATAGPPDALDSAEAEAIALGGSLAEAINTKRAYPDQDKMHAEIRESFRQLVLSHKDEWTHEYEYWQNNF